MSADDRGRTERLAACRRVSTGFGALLRQAPRTAPRSVRPPPRSSEGRRIPASAGWGACPARAPRTSMRKCVPGYSSRLLRQAPGPQPRECTCAPRQPEIKLPARCQDLRLGHQLRWGRDSWRRIPWSCSASHHEHSPRPFSGCRSSAISKRERPGLGYPPQRQHQAVQAPERWRKTLKKSNRRVPHEAGRRACSPTGGACVPVQSPLRRPDSRHGKPQAFVPAQSPMGGVSSAPLGPDRPTSASRTATG